MAGSIHYILRSYYERLPMQTSYMISREVQYYYTEKGLKRADPNINTDALVELIKVLSEEDLRSGKANLAISLRTRFGRYTEPALELEEGYVPTLSANGAVGGRKIDDEKMLLILKEAHKEELDYHLSC